MLITDRDFELKTINGLKCQDPVALTDLYGHFSRFVYSIVVQIVRNGGEAEELVQEVFLRLWIRADQIDSARPLAPWILTLARNLAIDNLRAARARGNHIEHTPFHSTYIPSYLQHTLAADYTDGLKQAFSLLTAEQRVVIEFAYFEGLSQTEISTKLGKPLGTVKTWLRTALIVLRKRLAPYP